MRCVRKWWTLICYAGSASEASIGSRPMGSELMRYMGIVGYKSQDFPDERLSASSYRHIFGGGT